MATRPRDSNSKNNIHILCTTCLFVQAPDLTTERWSHYTLQVASSIITHEKECRDPRRPHASRVTAVRETSVATAATGQPAATETCALFIYLPPHDQPAARPTALPEFLLLLRPNMTGLLIPGRRRRSRLHVHSSRGWTLGEPCVRACQKIIVIKFQNN